MCVENEKLLIWYKLSDYRGGSNRKGCEENFD